MKKILRVVFVSSIILVSKMNATVYCTSEEAQVVAAAGINLAALKLLHKEIEKSVDISRSMVQVSMAQTVEKEKILSTLVLLKNNMNLRSDMKSALAREILLNNEAALLNLNENFNKSLVGEIKSIEDGVK